MRSPRPILLPREGLTLDFVASSIRNLFLNPWRNSLLYVTLRACGAALRGVLMRDPIRQTPLYSWLLSCAITGLILDMNGYLTSQYHNNWTRDETWDWNKEIVLITGGSSGIGADVAQLLQTRNRRTRIIIIDYVPLTVTPKYPETVRFFQCDLTRPSEINSTCARIRQEVGDPTVIFNNAGLSRGKTIVEGAYEDVQVTMAVNLLAPFFILKEFLPTMIKRNHGHIVATSSMSSIITPAGLADYGASKAGLAVLHTALQLELANKHGARSIRTSRFTLSFTETPMFKGRTNQSNFTTPLLKVETVGDAIVDVLYSGYGKNVFMPGIMRYISCVTAWPEWCNRIFAEETTKLEVDYVGRQQISDGKMKPLSR